MALRAKMSLMDLDVQKQSENCNKTFEQNTHSRHICKNIKIDISGMLLKKIKVARLLYKL